MGEFHTEAGGIHQRDRQQIHGSNAQVVQTGEPLLKLFQSQTERRQAFVPNLLQRFRELTRHGQHVPHLLLALILVSTLGKGGLNAAFAIALAVVPSMARVTRSVALVVRRQEYVQAAIARGESGAWIVLREMLPNVAAPVIIEATIRVAFAVMLFATLSFLGLGAQPPASEWGLMVSEARRFMHQAPWVIVAPSLAIAATAICFNLLGDGLRDALNPRDER